VIEGVGGGECSGSLKALLVRERDAAGGEGNVSGGGDEGEKKGTALGRIQRRGGD